MAKDPAVLFYTSDFISGTLAMSDEQVGKYTRLLCLQHQKYRLSEAELLKLSGNDEMLIEKFKAEIIDSKKYYFNERMRDETVKRKNYTESRRANLRAKGKSDNHMKEHMENHMKEHIDNHMKEHMENENENENEDIIRNEIEKKNENENEKIVEKNPFNECREIFLKYYEETIQVPYIWDYGGKDDKNLKLLIGKIERVYKQSGRIKPSYSELIAGFSKIIYSISDTWILSHLEVANINSQFNKILAQLKNGKYQRYKGHNADNDKWNEIFRELEEEKLRKAGQSQSGKLIEGTGSIKK